MGAARPYSPTVGVVLLRECDAVKAGLESFNQPVMPAVKFCDAGSHKI